MKIPMVRFCFLDVGNHRLSCHVIIVLYRLTSFLKKNGSLWHTSQVKYCNHFEFDWLSVFSVHIYKHTRNPSPSFLSFFPSGFGLHCVYRCASGSFVTFCASLTSAAFPLGPSGYASDSAGWASRCARWCSWA